MIRSILSGVLGAVGGIFPLAALVALLYRFPFPFAGYRGGWAAAMDAPKAAHFYLLLGGYLVVALVGTAAGVAAWRCSKGTNKAGWRLAVPLALAGDFVLVSLLSVWDKVYGPW